MELFLQERKEKFLRSVMINSHLILLKCFHLWFRSVIFTAIHKRHRYCFYHFWQLLIQIYFFLSSMYFYINYLGFYPLIPQAQFNNEEFSFNHIHFTQMVFCFLEATSTLICCFFNNINFIIYRLLSLQNYLLTLQVGFDDLIVVMHFSWSSSFFSYHEVSSFLKQLFPTFVFAFFF